MRYGRFSCLKSPERQASFKTSPQPFRRQAFWRECHAGAVGADQEGVNNELHLKLENRNPFFEGMALVKNSVGSFLATRISAGSLGLPAAILLALSSLLGYLGDNNWVCDLFSHFKAQYLIAAFLCLVWIIVLGILSRRRSSRGGTENPEAAKRMQPNIKFAARTSAAIVLIAVVALNLIEIVPLYIHSPRNAPVSPYNKIRLMSVNVNTANKRHEDLVNQIVSADPDILLLMEVNDKWVAALDDLRKTYPHSVIYPQEDNFGIALFSKNEPTISKVSISGQYRIPHTLTKISIGSSELTILGIHTLPPVSDGNSSDRNLTLQKIAEFTKNTDSHIVVMGDLNVTPWSKHFKKLLLDGKLRNSQKGYGIQPTWPAQNIFMRIPIDHCLTSEGIAVFSRQTGSAFGSDHFPIIVEIGIPTKTIPRH